MVATDSEIISEREMDPSSQANEQHSKNQTLESLGTQSSIYSLTLDEFQNTLCESGKNFGSMNMDEFLNSIWTAEENQAQGQGTSTGPTSNGNANVMQYPGVQEANPNLMDHKGIAKQHSLPRQGSLTIPEPLSRKTVDEVWSEIHKNQYQNNSHEHIQNPSTTQKQSTLGEMTLEDFLVRAGVVREQHFSPGPPQQPGFAMYPNNTHPAMGPTFVARPVTAVGSGGVMPVGGINNVASYQALQGGVIEARPGYPGGGYSQPPSGVTYGARLGNGSGGGFGQVQGLGMGSPLSPLSDANQVDGGNQYGDGMRGARKRVIDGPVEKVVERRQRRMIKNRESAARSRARKQAYTIELEAELNQLKEENLQLQQALAELERQRKQQYYEEEEARAGAQMQSKSFKANEKLRAMRRSSSCPYW
ncbi:hypothetical protein ACS0TY_016566 [Phlomoides rotata]